MDINLVRGVITVVSLAVFIGIVVWAYGKGRKSRFEEAANLPFADDDRAHRA
jgi:cytochrome c oxidase cbb3-type subunit 4